MLSPDTASSYKHSLLTGLSKRLVLVFIFTLRTAPLESSKVSTTLPMSQKFQGEELSTNNTTSPVEQFLRGLDYFCRSWSSGRYSQVHMVQNKSAIYWTCFQRFLVHATFLLKMPGGMVGCDFNSNKLLGVRGSRSFTSSEILVRGLPLMMLSTSHRTV